MSISIDLTTDFDKSISPLTKNVFDHSKSEEETILTFPYWTDVSFPGHCVNIVNMEANKLFTPWHSKTQYQLGEDVEIKVKSTDDSSIERTVLGKVASLNDNCSCVVEIYTKDSVHRNVLVNITDMRPFDGDDRMLNDSLVEFGILHALHQSMLKDQANSKFYFIGTKMYTKFLEYLDRHKNEHLAYREVHKWTKHVDLFSKEVILFPIHEFTHWYLIAFLNIGTSMHNVVSQPGSTVEDHSLIFVMDSLPKQISYYNKHILNLCSYLSLEYFAKKMTTLQVATTGVGISDLKAVFKNVPRVILKSPKQPNGYDCGMYLIRNCRNLIANYPSLKDGVLRTTSSKKTISPIFDYNQEDVQNDRMLMFDVIVSTYEESIIYKNSRTHETDEPKKSTEDKEVLKTTAVLNGKDSLGNSHIEIDEFLYDNISCTSGKRKALDNTEQEALQNIKQSVKRPYNGFDDWDFFNLSFI